MHIITSLNVNQKLQPQAGKKGVRKKSSAEVVSHENYHSNTVGVVYRCKAIVVTPWDQLHGNSGEKYCHRYSGKTPLTLGWRGTELQWKAACGAAERPSQNREKAPKELCKPVGHKAVPEII